MVSHEVLIQYENESNDVIVMETIRDVGDKGPKDSPVLYILTLPRGRSL